MWLFFVLAVHAAPRCYTEQDLKNAACQVACVKDGHNGGFFKKVCICFDKQDEGYLDDAVILGVRLPPNESEAPQPYRFYHSED